MDERLTNVAQFFHSGYIQNCPRLGQTFVHIYPIKKDLKTNFAEYVASFSQLHCERRVNVCRSRLFDGGRQQPY